MRKIWIMGLALAFMARPAGAADKAVNVDPDLRCLATFSAAAASVDEAHKPQMAVAVMYFVGRLDGERPDIDLKAELVRVVGAMKDDQLEAESKRCGAILSQRGAALFAVGNEMSKSGEGKPAAKP